MKKRRILLGLAMAAAAVFSLAACGDEEPANEPGTVEPATGGDGEGEGGEITPAKATYTVTFNTDGGSAVTPQQVKEGEKVQRPAQAPTKTETATEIYTFDNWYKDAAKTTLFNFSTETITAETVIYAKWNVTAKQVEKYDVKFFDGETELTALAQEVDEDGKVTKPAASQLPTQTGKRFVYWANDMDAPYDFNNAVTDDVSLYATYVDENDFDTLSKSTNNLVATSFYDTTLTAVDSISFNSDAVTYKTVKNATLNYDNTVKLAAEAGTQFGVDLGDKKINATGIVTTYFTVKFTGVANGEAFFMVDGKLSGASSSGEVFALRTKKDERADSSTKNKNVLTYRYGGTDGAEIFSNFEPTSGATGATYAVKVVLDTADGKASVYVDGTLVFDDINISIDAINGVKFTSKSGTEKFIDDVAINYEAKAVNPVVTAKNAATKLINDYIASTAYTGADKVVQDMIDAQATVSLKAINDSDTEAEVATARTTWETFANTGKYVVTVTPLLEDGSAVTGLTALKFAVLDGGVVDSTKVEYAGYVTQGLYLDNTLSTLFAPNTQIDQDTNLYVKVAEASVVTLTYTPHKAAEGDTWTLGSTGTSFKADQADGAASGNYNAIQIQLKESESKDGYIQSEVLPSETNTVRVNMTGWTGAGSSRAGDIVQIVAYNASNEEIGTATVYTSADKKNGAFTSDAAGSNTDITVTASENISYLRFVCIKDTKSYFVTSITISYDK